MSYGLTSVQKGEPVCLLEPINNRAGRLRVTLQRLTLTVGWFNTEEETSFQEQNESTSATKTVVVEPVLYTFDDLKWLLESGESNVLLKSNLGNGIASLTVGAD